MPTTSGARERRGRPRPAGETFADTTRQLQLRDRRSPASTGRRGRAGARAVRRRGGRPRCRSSPSRATHAASEYRGRDVDRRAGLRDARRARRTRSPACSRVSSTAGFEAGQQAPAARRARRVAWLRNPRNEGVADVGGEETVKITGAADDAAGPRRPRAAASRQVGSRRSRSSAATRTLDAASERSAAASKRDRHAQRHGVFTGADGLACCAGSSSRVTLDPGPGRPGPDAHACGRGLSDRGAGGRPAVQRTARSSRRGRAVRRADDSARRSSSPVPVSCRSGDCGGRALQPAALPVQRVGLAVPARPVHRRRGRPGPGRTPTRSWSSSPRRSASCRPRR